MKNKLIYNFIANVINFTILQFCFLNLLNIETLFPIFFSLRTKRKILFSKIFISYETRNFQAKLQLFNYLLYYIIIVLIINIDYVIYVIYVY